MRGLRHRIEGETLRAPGIAGSVALHGLAVATFLLAGGLRGVPVLPPVYRVTLIAPLGPATTPTPSAAPSASRSPAKAPAPPLAHPAPTRSRGPAVPLKPAAKAPKPAAATASPHTAHPTPAVPAKPAPAPAAPVPTSPAGAPGGTGPATIRTEGVEFPFPGYLNNLVAQVYHRWRPPPSNAQLEAEVFFLVHRDGSVTGLQFIRRSGSFAFDLEAQGAIEAASRAGVFGPLPSGYAADVLPVSFFFNPTSPR